MAENKKSKNLWNFLDYIEGDKVVWIIAIMLIFISIVAIFSSTPLLALQQHTTRIEIIKEQLVISVVGLAVMFGFSRISKIGVIRFFSQFGFLVSAVLLGILFFKIQFGDYGAKYLNNAWRVIQIPGMQIHVSEVVKVSMVMYLAWAVMVRQKDEFLIANLLGKRYPFFRKQTVKDIMYLYLPICIVGLGLMKGGLSSTIFIGGIMLLTLFVGGIPFRHLLIFGAILAGMLLASIGLNKAAIKATGTPIFDHLETALNRLDSKKDTDYYIDIMKTYSPSSVEFREAVDKLSQPMSAKIAIKEGRIPKGPGRSTQRYITPIMFEDYMFSFLVEEYGLLGMFVILALYVELLARGSIIVRNCENLFAKTAVAGLALLISGQAMMHILVNCDLGPMTGQTLPMISHGNSSFLMFSIAFGIILSISRMAQRKVDKAAREAKPIGVSGHTDDKDKGIESASEDPEQLEETTE